MEKGLPTANQRKYAHLSGRMREKKASYPAGASAAPDRCLPERIVYYTERDTHPALTQSQTATSTLDK